ncbi:hypothetical protein [Agromyces sp. NPDC058126]|uniref:hypothetical protein n=1 Tax=Agromyces sp. NPDC058126 TaxID=3346350 RepID=UPI0036DEC3D9
MTPRRRLTIALVAIALFAGALAYGLTAYFAQLARASSPSEAVTTTDAPAADEPRLVFRNTAAGQGYGNAAVVALDDPAGARTILPIACDRIDASDAAAICLHTDRGVVTTFGATLYTADWQAVRSWPLAGIPSRARLSPDGELVATTAFVTGHSYATTGFSTQTVVGPVDGDARENLEDFALTVDGSRLDAVDRNLWGVTFAEDGATFYATAASGGRTWLVKGDVAARTLTSIEEDAECPSLSPDGTRIAFKRDVAESTVPDWRIAVLDLDSGEVTILPEQRSVDDQVEWLDDETLLYGMPGAEVGDGDLWRIAADGRSEASEYLRHASSPSVVR